MMNKITVLMVAFITGAVWTRSETENVTESVALSDKIPHPQEMQNHFLQEVKNICDKNGSASSSRHMQDVLSNVASCIRSVNNYGTVGQDFEKAKSLNKVDEFFKNYCERRMNYVSCASKFVESSKDCLSVEHRNQLKIIYDVFRNALEFLCYKEGERIALFIAENGLTCLETKAPDLHQCLENVINSDPRFKLNNVHDIMEFDRLECDNVSVLQKCAFDALETCPSPTVANMFQSLYKFIRKITPCDKFPDPYMSDSASSLNVCTITFIMGSVTFLLL